MATSSARSGKRGQREAREIVVEEHRLPRSSELANALFVQRRQVLESNAHARRGLVRFRILPVPSDGSLRTDGLLIGQRDDEIDLRTEASERVGFDEHAAFG